MKNNNLKILMAQLNPVSGDVEYNKNKITDCIKSASKNNEADLIVFSELILLGNPIGDVLKRYPFVAQQSEKALDEIKKYCTNIRALIGFAKKNPENMEINSSIAYIENGEIKKVISDKAIIELNGVKLGIAFYNDSEIDKIAHKVDVLICPIASYSRAKKEQMRHEKMKNLAKKYGIKCIFVNQTGANGEFVYDGLSRMYSEKGELQVLARAFEQDFVLIDFAKDYKEIKPCFIVPPEEFSLDYSYDLERTYKAAVVSIKDYFQKNGFKRAVLGLSGGLDSSVCAVLCADALGAQNVLGISMPSHITSSLSKNDAKELAQNLGINFLELTIKQMQDCVSAQFNNLFDKINWSDRYTNSYTQDNIQARLRAMTLWAVSNEYPDTFTIATSDKSETYMGYATINGDMSGSFAPIADITKTKLFALGAWMNENRVAKNAIPKSILEKSPGAELAINPKTGKALTAEEALMPYEFLDEVIYRIENYHQNIEDMMRETFLYEKKNSISAQEKKQWLIKFFRRMNSALYKWYISVPSPIIDSVSINKAIYTHPVVSNIDYTK